MGITKDEYLTSLSKLHNMTIGIVYGFEKESAKGYSHYDLWKADVISDWMLAAEEIGCIVFLADVRTFVLGAMNNSLPKIDFVVNLSNGTCNLSSLGLVPSTCSFLNIPCVPCDASVALLGENKQWSNIIARSSNVLVPKDLTEEQIGGIYRPINLGSSKGVSKSKPGSASYLYQEFIRGYDVTTPIMYNPMSFELEVLPSIVYYPDNMDPNWFLGDNEKQYHKGYKKITAKLDDEAKKAYIELAKSFTISTYCRIDARITANSIEELNRKANDAIKLKDLYFSEINPMPTIKKDINFHTSLRGVDPSYNLFESI